MLSRRLGWVTLAVLLGAGVGAVPTLAAQSRGQVRTVTTDYSAPAGVTTPMTNGAPTVFSSGAATPARAGETRARATAQDRTGRPVALAVGYRPLHGSSQVTQAFCGTTPWLSIAPASTVSAEVLSGQCPGGGPSVPTTGTVSLSFFHPIAPAPVRGIAAPALRWAVIVGISRYAPPTEQTYGGDGDADAVRRALLHAGWLPSHILDIRDGRATASAIVSAERWLVAHSTPATFTLFHYSGHVCIASRGPCASGHTYLWGSDNGFISENTFAAVLRHLRGYSWIDVAGCEAGAFDAGLHSPSRVFTGSSQPGRTSYEQPSWHESVWAGLTWDRGFDRGAASRSGRPFSATIGQMIAYGVRNTAVVTQGQSAGTQHPYHAGGSPAWRLFAPPG